MEEKGFELRSPDISSLESEAERTPPCFLWLTSLLANVTKYLLCTRPASPPSIFSHFSLSHFLINPLRYHWKWQREREQFSIENNFLSTKVYSYSIPFRSIHILCLQTHFKAYTLYVFTNKRAPSGPRKHNTHLCFPISGISKDNREHFNFLSE